MGIKIRAELFRCFDLSRKIFSWRKSVEPIPVIRVIINYLFIKTSQTNIQDKRKAKKLAALLAFGQSRVNRPRYGWKRKKTQGTRRSHTRISPGSRCTCAPCHQLAEEPPQRSPRRCKCSEKETDRRNIQRRHTPGQVSCRSWFAD